MGGPRCLLGACLVGVRCRYDGKDVPNEECRAFRLAPGFGAALLERGAS